MDTDDFLIICIDSLRRDHCPGFGETFEDLSTLTRLAESGARFTRTISPSVWTHAVHASLFTGLFPPEHGLHGGEKSLANTQTLGDLLSGAGYDTHLISNCPWLDHGNVGSGWTKSLMFSPGSQGLSRIPRICRRLAGTGQTPDDLVVDEAVEKLRDRQEKSAVFVHLNDVHHPYEPKTPYHRSSGLSRFRTAVSLYRQIEFFDDNSIFAECAADSVSDRFLSSLRKTYKACVRQVDDRVERLLDAASPDTTVIVYADHGENLGDDRTFSHQYSLSDALIRVPLIVRDPQQRIEQGEHDQVVMLHDLFETILSLAGIEVPNRSTIDLREGRESAFVDFRPNPSLRKGIESSVPDSLQRPHWQQSVWTPEAKLIRYPNEDETIGEEGLMDLYEDYRASFEDLSVESGATVSEEVEERLGELGYR